MSKKTTDAITKREADKGKPKKESGGAKGKS